VRTVKHMMVAAKAPDAKGTFDGTIIYNPTEGDSDGERVANFTNTPTTVPLDFQHLIVMDPGSVIGQIKAVEVGDGKTLAVHGVLSVGQKMADAVHERMLLTNDDPMVLKELSIAYAYDPSLNTTDKNGVVAIHDAELLAISVVHAGAQPTRVMNVKSELDVLEKTALAGLISVDQAMQYAEDLGIPGDISQKLFESSATSEKYMGAEAPAGSYEERQEDLEDALRTYGGPDAWVYPVATFPDRVVACVCTDAGDTYLQFPYAYDGENVTLGSPTEVELETSIVAAAKARALAMKWDGSAAMSSAKNAADFRKIAFERNNDSDPDTAAHWALPHHSSPGAAADKTGVAAALAALNGARGGAPDLKNKSAAQSHLEAHQSSFGSEKAEEAEVAQTGEAHVDVVVDHIVINEKEMTVNEAREFLKLPPLPEGESEGEKAQAQKPWHIGKQDGKFCVIKDSDNSTMKCYDSEDEAKNYLAALYANEKAESEKAGRVIGAKRALKSAITAAIDEFAQSVNGDLSEKDQQVGELLDEKADEVDDLKAKLDELAGDAPQTEEKSDTGETYRRWAEEADAEQKAAAEELDDYRLRLEALSQL
jgi:hypothetical protein